MTCDLLLFYGDHVHRPNLNPSQSPIPSIYHVCVLICTVLSKNVSIILNSIELMHSILSVLGLVMRPSMMLSMYLQQTSMYIFLRCIQPNEKRKRKKKNVNQDVIYGFVFIFSILFHTISAELLTDCLQTDANNLNQNLSVSFRKKFRLFFWFCSLLKQTNE